MMLPAAMIARGTATWRPWTMSVNSSLQAVKFCLLPTSYQMCAAVPGVGLVLGVGPCAYAFLGRRAVLFAVPRGEREVVEGGDCHVASFPVAEWSVTGWACRR